MIEVYIQCPSKIKGDGNEKKKRPTLSLLPNSDNVWVR